MLKILTNLDLYRYEIHALVKAFFPAEDVKVFLAGEIPEKEAFLTVWYRRVGQRI